MNEREFYHHIKDGEFAFVDYPLQGISALYSHGTEVQDKISDKFINKLTDRGYSKVTLPQSVPETFISHLHKKGLFIAKNENREFYLSGSMEMQATSLAKTMVLSHKDLPLRFFSKSTVYRECDSSSLIKSPEYISYELNSYFNTKTEAEDEMVNTGKIAESWLTELNIPFVAVKAKPESDSPIVLYVYFPFSGSFGTIFWGGVVGKKYSEKVNFKYHGSDNKQHLPYQYNAGFTGRILSAYLANNSDKHGFVLKPSVSPSEILVPRDYKNPINSHNDNQVENFPFSVTEARVSGRQNLINKFGSMGLPILLENGKHEIRLTQRNSMTSRWVNQQDLTQTAQHHLYLAETTTIANSISIHTINDVDETVHLEKNTVYNIPISAVNKFQQLGLKTIGYVDQENVYMVLKKY